MKFDDVQTDRRNPATAPKLLRESSELGLGAGDQQQVHVPVREGPGDVWPDSMRGTGQDGVADLHYTPIPVLG